MLPRRRTVTLLVVLCLGHVLLISAQVPAQAGSSVLHAMTFGALTRFQGAIGGLAEGVGGLWTRYAALRGVERDNEELRQRVLALEGQLQGERARGLRVDGLEDALALQRSVVAPTLAARVIAGNPVPGVLTVNLDRGAADGVRPNMAVINSRGVVGRVIGTPSAHSAAVQLLADRSASAGALLERSGTAGSVASGFADGLLRLTLISSTTDVSAGERVLTSGQDGIYPQGFLIGEVVQINEAGKAREIVVAPAVDFARLDVVLVVMAAPVEGGDSRP
jgi:rod shape-determining protein MreC